MSRRFLRQSGEKRPRTRTKERQSAVTEVGRHDDELDGVVQLEDHHSAYHRLEAIVDLGTQDLQLIVFGVARKLRGNDDP